MRAAIVTLHRVYNFGSVLQAYATQCIFEKAGFDTVIIDYISPQRTKKQILKNAAAGSNKELPVRLYKPLKLISIILKELTFGRFINKNLNLTKKYITSEDLEADPPEADVYITGSDQTWNSEYNKGVDRGFFLTFAPDNKPKVSFVSSFGKTILEESEIRQTKPLIDKYCKLSVRENSGLAVLKQLGRSDGVQLIDPTLQLTKEEWLRIASPRLVKDPYLILMLLYNEDNHATEYARKIADEKGLRLVKISWELRKPEMVDQLFTHRSPKDFLSLFAFADFVVTNSFHGLAFAINLERQFIVVPRNEFNSRIESLLALTGLSEKLVSTMDKVIIESKKDINYAEINEHLKNERIRASDYIKEIIQLGAV
ncbi:MAG: polysaccharide pyruvyl transferase family protein [Clostridiaceae bacterium]|mgnify:CR=1 FL=1|nr:polysaccharide pyruvyl transferase family protein [Clostridiaceae bacterium]